MFSYFKIHALISAFYILISVFSIFRITRFFKKPVQCAKGGKCVFRFSAPAGSYRDYWSGNFLRLSVYDVSLAVIVRDIRRDSAGK